MNRTLIPTVILSTFVTGCSPTVDNRGYENDNRDFTKIIPGQTTRDFVEENYGSPSTISAFKPETWYYISKQTETKAFFTPVTTDLISYEIIFTDSGIVSKVMERKGEHVREITPVKRETPSAGHQSGLLREVFSNFGKISAKSTSRTGTP